MDINDSENLNIEDLNIEDYNITDLVNMFELEFPLKSEEVLAKLDTYVMEIIKQNNPALVAFLEQARAKLMKSIKPDEPEVFQDTDDETDAAQVLDDEYWPNDKDTNLPNRKDMTRIVTQQPYSILQRERLNISQQKSIEHVQGQLNPNLKNTYTRLLNVDSQYREILDLSENLCAPPDTQKADSWKGTVSKSNLNLDTPTDFTFDLSEPLNNVVEIMLYDVQLSRSWYIFSRNYETNTFWVDGTQYFIKSGNYSAGSDISVGLFAPAAATWGGVNNVSLNEDGTVLGASPVTFLFDQVTHKTTITSAVGAIVTFYSDVSGNICGPGGGKRDYNLGWLLGFRKKSYTIDGGGSIVSEALVDTFGTKYVYIMLDDYNKNRITYNLLGMTNNRDNFKIPSYYNKNTMSTDCSANNLIESKERPCRKGTPSTLEFFPLDNLTKAQQYTANSILQSQQSKKIDRYFSPTNPNILAKIPILHAIERGNIDNAGITVSPLFGIINMSPNLLKKNKRTYFGPVTIKRFHVQLLNDKGLVIDLNGMDWSFSLKIKQLYQY
jgi:hypothetical protein